MRWGGFGEYSYSDGLVHCTVVVCAVLGYEVIYGSVLGGGSICSDRLCVVVVEYVFFPPQMCVLWDSLLVSTFVAFLYSCTLIICCE
jgi:hypothetical protein